MGRAIGLVAIALTCACNPARASARPIELLVTSDAETLDPRHATDPTALRTTRLIHAGLIDLDPDTLAPRPRLAESWSWLDPLTLRVVLREGITFHSGAPLRGEDVAATLRAFASPAVGSRHANVVEAIGAIELEGRFITIRLRHRHATLLTDLELPILRADEAASPPRPDGSLDGLGPYVVAHRESGEIDLEPAPHERAHAIVIRTVHDENARALRMHAGRGDLVVNGFSPTLLPALESAPGLAVASRPGANLTYLVVRTDRGVLADVRIRRALSLAIDRERIARTLLAGHATSATTLIPPIHWAHVDEPPIPFDSEGARALLDGARIHLTLLTSTDRVRGTIARTIAQELASAGIVTEVVPLELGTMIARLGAGDFELAMLQMPEFTEPNVLRVFLHSSEVPPVGANRGRVRDPELDALLDLGDTELDHDKRRLAYDALERRVRDQAFVIPLWHEDQVWVTSERARAFRPSAIGRWLGLASL